MRKITTIWKCKNGTKVRICDMTDSHLVNTINMLERFAKNKVSQELSCAFSVEPFLTGDIAIFTIENNIDNLMEDDSYERFLPPIYNKLLEEQTRRTLAPNQKARE